MFKSAVVMMCAVICAVTAGLFILSTHSRPAAPEAEQDTAMASVTSEAAAQTSDGHTTAIPKSSDGHFWAYATVNDKAVRFLVDTGATVVVLTPADATRLGVMNGSLVFDRKVITAMGPTLAAKVTLNSVGIGQSQVHQVDALIIREGLSTSLLGMSYLGRLSRFEATPSSLILHP